MLTVLSCICAILWLVAPTVAQAQAPEKMANISASVMDKEVTFRWDAQPDANINRYSYRYDRESPTPDEWDQGWTNTRVASPSTATSWVWSPPEDESEPYGTYYFQFRARNSEGRSPNSDTIEVTLTQAEAQLPSKPDGLTATPGNGRVVLQWNDPNDTSITHYQVQRDGGAWMDVDGSGASTRRHVVTGLTNGTEYTFAIQAVNDEGVGPPSDTVSATPRVLTKPAKVANVGYEVTQDRQVTFTWDDPQDPSIDKYQFRYDRSSPEPVEWDQPFRTTGVEDPSTTTSWVWDAPEYGTYFFQFRAQNADGSGPASDSIEVIVQRGGPPVRPTGFTATWVNTFQAELNWDDPQDASIAYEFRFSSDLGGFWRAWTSAAATCDGSTCGTTAPLFTAAESYYLFELRVQSEGDDGEVAQASTGASPDAPHPPQLKGATPEGPGRVTLQWTPASTGSPATGWEYRSLFLESETGSAWSQWTPMNPVMLPGESGSQGLSKSPQSIAGSPRQISADSISYLFTMLLPRGTRAGQYQFQVRGSNANGVGSSSNAVLAMVEPTVPPLLTHREPQAFLLVGPPRLTFHSEAGGDSVPAEHLVLLFAMRNEVAFFVEITSNWLLVMPLEGELAKGASKVLRVGADPTGLVRGTHLGEIHVVSESGRIFGRVSVSLEVQ